MARRRTRRRSYKLTNVATKNLGSSGAQVRVAEIDKLDAQGINGYLNNIRLSVLLNDPESIHTNGAGGFIAYLTTDDAWSDDYVITAAAGNFSDTVNLSAKRWIQQNNDQIKGNQGMIHLWIELSDTSITSHEVRYVAETWGNFIAFTEV